MAYSIFFSHGAADSNVAKTIKDRIEQMNMDVYLYEYDQQPGKYIASKLQNAIDSADVMLVLLTTLSQFSPYMHQEIGYAEAKGKLVIPLVEPGIDPPVLGMLAGREYISFESNNADQTMSQLQCYLNNLKMDKDNREFLILCGVAFLIVMILIAYSMSKE